MIKGKNHEPILDDLLLAHPHLVIEVLNCAETVLACARSIYQSSGASSNSSIVSRP